MVFLCPMVLLCPMVFLCPVKNPPYNDDKEVRNPAMKRKRMSLRERVYRYVQVCYVT